MAEERRPLNQHREEVREEMILKAGSAREAFSALDQNKSGRVSLNEFDGGMRSLGVKWEELTGYDKIRRLFQLFDHDKKGYVTFANLFPLDARESAPERMSTPEFWKYWCNQNKKLMASSSAAPRLSRWDPGGPEGKLELIAKSRQQRAEVAERKKWMKGMIHRLKHRGKSDARCREIVAPHLPRGSGPRDVEGVHTLTKAEVSACKKAYTDKVQESVRNIEKTVFDMHDQRKKLHHSKQMLFAITEEPLLRQRELEQQRASLLGGLGCAGGFLKADKYHEIEAE